MSWIATPESSNISGFDYMKETQVLIVEFKNGGRYNYYDVPEAVFEGMKTASSKGQFLAQNVKNVYRYARV
jgi:KTSC domain